MLDASTFVAAPIDVFACVVQAARKQTVDLEESVRPRGWFARRRDTSEFWFVGLRRQRRTQSYWLPTRGFVLTSSGVSSNLRRLRRPVSPVQCPQVLRHEVQPRKRARARVVRTGTLLVCRQLRLHAVRPRGKDQTHRMRTMRRRPPYWLPTDGFLASVRRILRPPKWQWAMQLPFVLRQVGLARQRARSRSVRNRLLICVRKLRPLLLV